jgi:hypothetical protein
MNTDITLPDFEKAMLPVLERSMDDINSWIEEDFELFFNQAIYEDSKKRLSVKYQFTLE